MRGIKSSIIKYLGDKKNYQDYDKAIIQELISVQDLANKCKKAYKTNTPFIGKTKKEDVIFYLQCVQKINDIYTKLGITPQERVKLKLEEAKTIEKTKYQKMREEQDENDE
jgi:hypothetical protein